MPSPIGCLVQSTHPAWLRNKQADEQVTLPLREVTSQYQHSRSVSQKKKKQKRRQDKRTEHPALNLNCFYLTCRLYWLSPLLKRHLRSSSNIQCSSLAVRKGTPIPAAL
jgi:hypothetical protein